MIASQRNHDAREVPNFHGGDKRKAITWQAHCPCGWRGPDQRSPADARDDSAEHRAVEASR